MIPNLMHSFRISAGTLGAIIACYYYAYTPLQLVVGILIDKYGTRSIMTISVIICVVGSFLFGSHSIYLLGIGRLLIGIGSAFSFVGVLKLAAEWLPKHHFALVTGCTVSLGILGAMTGMITLTATVHTIGWKHTIYVGTAIGVILIPLIWIFIQDKPAWRSANIKNKTKYHEVFSGLWQIIAAPQMWLTGIISGILYLSLSAFAELWGIAFLQRVYSITPHKAAFACAMVFAGWLIGAPLISGISEKIKTRKLPLFIGSLVTTIAITLIIIKPVSFSFPILCTLLFLFGIGSCSHVMCFIIGRENNPTHIAATAISFINLLTMTGGIIFQPLIGKLLDWFWDGKMYHHIHYYSAADYQHALMFLPGLMLLSTILTLFLHETHSREDWDEFDVQ